MDVDAVVQGKGKGCFVCGRPGHAAKDCKFNHAKGKAQGKGKAKNTRLTRTLQPSLKASVATVARKVTSERNAGSVWQR